MKERHIHREYLAVVQGLAPERGTIDAPIGRQPGSVIARCVDPVSGEPAITHYTRVAASPDGTYSLMRIHLDTGRTHQIRVHMAYIGHPILGDTVYGRKKPELGAEQSVPPCRGAVLPAPPGRTSGDGFRRAAPIFPGRA